MAVRKTHILRMGGGARVAAAAAAYSIRAEGGAVSLQSCRHSTRLNWFPYLRPFRRPKSGSGKNYSAYKILRRPSLCIRAGEGAVAAIDQPFDIGTDIAQTNDSTTIDDVCGASPP